MTLNPKHPNIRIAILLPILLVLSFTTTAQRYNESAVFSHNDYENVRPFFGAHDYQVGYVEADVFLIGDDLFVAHTLQEIDSSRTLQTLYLNPLKQTITRQKGNVYADPKKTFTLMIDMKTQGPATLARVVKILEAYPEITLCQTLTIAISGNVPDRTTWSAYPNFILFDGRPGISYTEDQLKRIGFISTSFALISKWKGTGEMDDLEKQKIRAVVDKVHAIGKKVRFWATPDTAEAWKFLMSMDVDIINTDDVPALTLYLARVYKR